MSALDLRLIVITDEGMAGDRGVIEVVHAALAAGAPAVQLRAKNANARDLLEKAEALLPVVHRYGARFFVNDRIDVALLAGADGAHLGPDDLPIAAARRIVPPGFLLGASCDRPETARAAERDGADYIGCGAVFGTTSKEGLEDERIGTGRLDQVARAVRIPVVAIGGITTDNAHLIGGTAARGIAVIGAVMKAADPGSAVRSLIAALRTGERARSPEST